MRYSIVAGFLFALLISVTVPCQGQSYEWRRIHPEAAQQVLPDGSDFWTISYFSLRLYRDQKVLTEAHFPHDKVDWSASPRQLVRGSDYVFVCIDEVYRINPASGEFDALTKLNSGNYVQVSATGVILMLGGGFPTLSRSTDGGRTFQGFNPGGWIGSKFVRDMEAYQTGFVAITSAGILLKSLDSGLNWEKITIDLATDSIAYAKEICVLADSILVVAATLIPQGSQDSSYDAIFRSTDGGTKWEMVSVGLKRPVLELGGSDALIVIQSSFDDEGSARLHTYVSADGGVTWSDFMSPSIAVYSGGDVEGDGDRVLMAAPSGVYELSIPSDVPLRTHPDSELMLSATSE